MECPLCTVIFRCLTNNCLLLMQQQEDYIAVLESQLSSLQQVAAQQDASISHQRSKSKDYTSLTSAARQELQAAQTAVMDVNAAINQELDALKEVGRADAACTVAGTDIDPDALCACTKPTRC